MAEEQTEKLTMNSILNQHVIEQITHLYDLIAAREYGVIARLGQPYNIKVMEEDFLEETFEEYPATFIPHPHVSESITGISRYSDAWYDHLAYRVDSSAWTKEEGGQCGLTVFFDLHHIFNNGGWFITLHTAYVM
jgi:hypothetical protein